MTKYTDRKRAGLMIATLAVLGFAGAARADLQSNPDLKFPLLGSEPRQAVKGRHLGLTNANESVSVTLVVRRQNAAEFQNLVSAIESGNPMAHPISREELATRYGAAPADLAQVQAFAAAHGLTVQRVNQAGRSITVSGPAAKINSAFGVQLHSYVTQAGKAFHTHAGAVQIPLSLTGVVTSVVGLDNQPHFHPYIKKSHQMDDPQKKGTSFSPPQVASLYQFPTGSAAGQCIAVIELGGGFEPSDEQTFFSGLGLQVPNITAVGVDGGSNAPGQDPDGADGEVELDIQVAGSVAPGAGVVAYFGGNTNQAFLDAITQAAHDTTNHCSVISISWGGPEDSWDSASMNSMDAALADAVAAGVTVTVASGDSGSLDDSNVSTPTVDFPGSSPHALSCGGTTLSASGSSITNEVVWNLTSSNEGAGGGGLSTVFQLPSYQNGLSYSTTSRGPSALTMRGVPDVAGDAAPTSGYNVFIDGNAQVVGGTSAVAPLYAGLFALINAQRSSDIGYVNATLYSHASAFKTITSGDNGTYQATTGWSAATGLGSPIGSAIQALF